MKPLINLFFLLLFGSVFAQEIATEIHFLDGTSLKGEGMLVGRGVLRDQEGVKFRVSSDSKAEFMDSGIISGATFTTTEGIQEYRYVRLTKTSLFPKLLKVMSEGEVMLYADGKRYYFVEGADKEHAFRFVTDRVKSDEEDERMTMYAKRESEEFPTNLSGLLTWKSRVKKYFSDCDTIAKKIDDKTYNIYSLPELVDFYNDYCVD